MLQRAPLAAASLARRGPDRARHRGGRRGDRRDDHAAHRRARRRARCACSGASRSRPDDDFGSLSAAAGGARRRAARGGARHPAGQFREQPEEGATYASKIERERPPCSTRAARPMSWSAACGALNPHVGTFVELADGERLGVRPSRARPDVERRAGGLTRARRRASAAAARRPGVLELLEVQPRGRTADGSGRLPPRQPEATASRLAASRTDRIVRMPAPRRPRARARRAPAAASRGCGVEPARPLPLRLLPAPLRAALGLPRLRRALHDRAHERHRQRDLPQLRRSDACAI